MTYEIVETIEIAATPQRVFRALTDPAQLRAWWGDPAVCVATHWELDARVGSRWRSRWHWTTPDGRGEKGGGGARPDFEIGGEVLAVEPPRHLVCSWRDDRYPQVPLTTVRYELQATVTGVRVRVIHSGFGGPTPDFQDYRGGWALVLAKLKGHGET
ncbi:MAG: SRPBCC family protein [Gemmatimonadales bacterium]